MNNYFQFQQFVIYQEHCAMKVSEMACIQGAWTKVPSSAKTLLDIGFGTGLLSLMLAQKNKKLCITAIEIEQSAFEQGTKNIQSSLFTSKITTMLGDVRLHNFNTKFDFIVCNPPFFENQLKTNNDSKNTAWHDNKLTLSDLLESIDKYLYTSGEFSILFPFQRKEELEIKASQFEFFPSNYLFIRHHCDAKFKFLIGIFLRKKTIPKIETLDVKDEKEYSLKMKSLIEDYYLNLKD
jgi:tRNA1Val (adenine37-N6)-methyltransferase